MPSPVAAPEVVAVAAPEVAVAAPVQVPAMTSVAPASQVLAGRVVWMAAVAEYYVTDPFR